MLVCLLKYSHHRFHSLPQANNMETEILIAQLQYTIGYQFVQPNLLTQALTAASVEETNYDGNRKLAQLGDSFIQSVLLDRAYSKGCSRSKLHNKIECPDSHLQDVANDVLQNFTSKKYRVLIAKAWNINDCVKCSPRQEGQQPSKTVLSHAVSAIVGASWIDSGRDSRRLERVVEAMR